MFATAGGASLQFKNAGIINVTTDTSRSTAVDLTTGVDVDFYPTAAALSASSDNSGTLNGSVYASFKAEKASLVNSGIINGVVETELSAGTVSVINSGTIKGSGGEVLDLENWTESSNSISIFNAASG